jgi:DNA-binding transcriptional regulator YdaS (Cro superfamily)
MEVDELIAELVRRAGSVVQAADLCGVTSRHVQKWVAGHSRPSPKSIVRIQAALDGDDVNLRKTRIEVYAERAAKKVSLFD